MNKPARLPATRGGRIAWQLALTLWVGGAWTLQFVMLPALERFGLAPILVQDIAGFMRPSIAGLAAVCVLIQMVICWTGLGRRWWRDARGQALLLALGAVAIQLLASVMSGAEYWQVFGFLLLCFAGLVLVVQPRPDEAVS